MTDADEIALAGRSMGTKMAKTLFDFPTNGGRFIAWPPQEVET